MAFGKEGSELWANSLAKQTTGHLARWTGCWEGYLWDDWVCEEALEDGQSWNPVVFLRSFAQRKLVFWIRNWNIEMSGRRRIWALLRLGHLLQGISSHPQKTRGRIIWVGGRVEVLGKGVLAQVSGVQASVSSGNHLQSCPRFTIYYCVTLGKSLPLSKFQHHLM